MAEPPAPAPEKRTPGLLPKNRLEALADGVLAIVITLLVLELKVPPVEETGELWHALTGEWREYAGYLISFVFVGGVWIAHSGATDLMGRGDAVLYRLNLLVLFFVSLLPFLTALMTTHLGEEGEGIAVALYGLNLFLASFTLNVFISYAGHHPDLAADDLADDELRDIERHRRVLVVGLGAAALVGLLLPDVAVGLLLLVALAFIVTPLILARRSRRSWDAAA